MRRAPLWSATRTLRSASTWAWPDSIFVGGVLVGTMLLALGCGPQGVHPPTLEAQAGADDAPEGGPSATGSGGITQGGALGSGASTSFGSGGASSGGVSVALGGLDSIGGQAVGSGGTPTFTLGGALGFGGELSGGGGFTGALPTNGGSFP